MIDIRSEIGVRGMSRITDILACMHHGDYIYSKKRSPKWWPFRNRLDIAYPYGPIWVSRSALEKMLNEGWIQDWGETYDCHIYAITEAGRGQVPPLFEAAS